jgi:hypothetical protein
MRSKDQVLLENLYSKKVLKENIDGGDRHGYFPDDYGNEPLDGVDPKEMEEVDQEKISLVQTPEELKSDLNSALYKLIGIHDTSIKIMKDSEINDVTYYKVEKEYNKLKNIIIHIEEFLGQR